jgi:hypothetical protein
MMLVVVDVDIDFEVPNLPFDHSSERHENDTGGTAELTI